MFGPKFKSFEDFLKYIEKSSNGYYKCHTSYNGGPGAILKKDSVDACGVINYERKAIKINETLDWIEILFKKHKPGVVFESKTSDGHFRIVKTKSILFGILEPSYLILEQEVNGVWQKITDNNHCETFNAARIFDTMLLTPEAAYKSVNAVYYYVTNGIITRDEFLKDQKQKCEELIEELRI